MQMRILLLLTLYLSTLFGAPTLDLFQRFPHRDGGPDTRGAIWYDAKNHNVFVADHDKGLWKIDECGNNYGDTTNRDNGLWDISHDGKYIFAVGKSGLIIYDESGNYVNSLNSIDGEGIYVQDGYAYIVNAGTAPADPSNPESKHVKKSNAKGGIIIVNVKDVSSPYIEDSVMTGEIFSQIRGGKVKTGSGESTVEHQMLYVTSLDGKLYLLEADGTNVTYKDDITLYPSSEARKLFVGKKDLIYVNSNYGELTIVKLNKSNMTLQKVGTWQSSDDHGNGQQSPAAGGVFVKEIKDGNSKKTYALITAADGNSDGYLYWLDVTDPGNIKHIDTLHDTEENYGFNDIWLNDTLIYLAAHNGFCFMGLKGTRNMPVISVKQNDGSYVDDTNLTQSAEKINDTKTFYVKINNRDSSNRLDARVTAPKAQSGWEYTFYDGDRNITENITGDNGYVMQNIPANSGRSLKITMTPVSDNASDATIILTATNKETKVVCGEPIDSDRVALKTTFSGENAFTCSENSYIFTSSSKKDPLDSYSVNIVTGKSHLEKSHFHDVNINAIGYNTTDNYIWGYDRVAHKMARVNAAYNVKLYTASGLPDKDYVAGDVSPDGILYLYDKDDKNAMIYGVNVDAGSSNFLKTVDSFKLPHKIQTTDMAFNPIDSRLYFMDNDNGDLYRLDITTHKLENLGNTQMPEKKKNSGAVYFDKDGNFYIYNNNGNIYKVDISDPDHVDPKVTFLDNAPEFESKDGARCPNAPAPKEPEKNECTLAFPGALSSTNDEIQINDQTKIYGTTNHTLITKVLSAKHSVRCDDAPCKKSGTLAKTLSFDLDLGNGKDGDKILTDNKSLTISSNKAYKKFQTGQNNKITINGDITIKSQSDFYINQGSAITINGNVVIYADKFDANQANQFKINGSLKIIANIFYLNSGNKLYEIPSADKFVVLAKDKIDINSQVDFKGLFYSGGDVQVNDRTRIIGALTGNYIDVNDRSYIGYDADAVNAYCSPKEHKAVKPSRFNVWDADESIEHQVIKTKIVDENITLTFASLNKEGTDFAPVNAKNIKVALFSPSEQLTVWHSLVPESATHMNTTFTTDDFTCFNQQHKAFKAVKAMIQYEENNGTKNVVASTDTFAIRPAKYLLSLKDPSAKPVAGKPFQLILKATNANGQIVSNYNEPKNVYDITYHEVKAPQGCYTGTLQMTKGNFSNGKATIQATYSEVGKLSLTAHEISTGNTEYAHIDNSDTTDRFIAPDTMTTPEFTAGKINLLTWDLQNGASNYTYFSSDPLTMGAKLILNLAVTATDGNQTYNFTPSCYAKDVNVTVSFATDTAAQSRQPLASYPNGTKINIPAMPAGVKSGNFSFRITKDQFSHGTGNETIWLNFKRDASKARNPLTYRIEKLKATVDTAQLDQNTSKQVIYLYARAYAPTQSVEGKKMQATLFYETYCNECNRNAYHLTDFHESVDRIHWYILPETETSSMDFDSLDSPDYIPTSEEDVVSHVRAITKLEKTDNRHIKIEVGATPLITKVRYVPLSYLRYNMFNPGASEHDFVVHFNPKPKSWAGRGKRGKTVDIQIGTRSAFDKIDW